jgi:hypothetical protein
VLVRAEGADFCLGGDVREWPGIPAHELRPRIEVFAKALERLEALKIPSVAAVHGGCMGGGFELALSCDFIVAASSARFAFPEARVGIMTLQGGVMQLAERIGRTKAIEAVMLSEPLPGRATGGLERREPRRRGPCTRRVCRDFRGTADCQPGPDERRDQGATVGMAEQRLPAR